jgi:hypothetical protein
MGPLGDTLKQENVHDRQPAKAFILANWSIAAHGTPGDGRASKGLLMLCKTLRNSLVVDGGPHHERGGGLGVRHARSGDHSLLGGGLEGHAGADRHGGGGGNDGSHGSEGESTKTENSNKIGIFEGGKGVGGSTEARLPGACAILQSMHPAKHGKGLVLQRAPSCLEAGTKGPHARRVTHLPRPSSAKTAAKRPWRRPAGATCNLVKRIWGALTAHAASQILYL